MAEIEGLKELAATLNTLGERVQRKVMRSAVNRGATPIVKAARENAPRESGLLAESMDKRIRSYVDQQTVVAIIGPDRETQGEVDGELRRPANYAHLVEEGHIAADGTFVPAQPFLRPAFDANESKALDIMSTQMGKGIEKEAAKQS